MTIQLRLNDGWSYRIAKELDAPSPILSEMKSNEAMLRYIMAKKYKASAGQKAIRETVMKPKVI